MKSIHILQLSTFYFMLSLQNAVCQTEQENFCYNEEECGPQSWGGLCSRGRSQSPIALTYNFVDLLNAAERELLASGAYFEEQRFFITNTGLTASVHLRRDLSSTAYMSGSLLGGRYVFSQMHFHWGSRNDRGSEHTVNKERMPMEAHLVHYANRFSGVTEALNSNVTGAVAVLAVFFHLAYEENRALNPIVRVLQEVEDSDDEAQGRYLLLADFIFQNPWREVEVIQYNGSLTTPDCAEVVQWNVMVPTIPISANQLNEFRRLRNQRGRRLINNFRPLQNLNGRVVRYFKTFVAR